MNSNNDQEKLCIICLENYDLDYYQCNICKNKFHMTCINKWSKKNNSCPICRSKIYLQNDEYDYDYDLYNGLDDYIFFSEELFLTVFIQFYIRTFFDILKEIFILVIYIFIIIIGLLLFKNMFI